MNHLQGGTNFPHADTKLPNLKGNVVSIPPYSVYGRVSQISAIYLFLYVFYAILRCISFKIRVNFLIELLRIYKTMVLTSFFDFIQAPSMRISLILHLNFAHIKPQQPNPVILVTILALFLHNGVCLIPTYFITLKNVCLIPT